MALRPSDCQRRSEGKIEPDYVIFKKNVMAEQSRNFLFHLFPIPVRVLFGFGRRKGFACIVDTVYVL